MKYLPIHRSMIAITMFLLTVPCLAQEAAPPDGEMKAKITAVQGTVQFRIGEDQEWRKAQVGDEIPTGADLRTGVRSAVTFFIPPDQTFTLDRLGTVRVLEAVADPEKVKTSLGMKYGRTRVQLKTGGREHETTVTTPGATLAVRGSDVTMQHDGFFSFATGNGKLEMIDRLSDQSLTFGDDGVDANAEPGGQGPGYLARSDATVDPQGAFSGRDDIETLLLEEHPHIGGNDYRDRLFFVVNSFGDISPQAFREQIFNSFQVDMFFFGGEDNVTDVNLLVIDPNGAALSAANPVTPNGRGRHSGNAIQQNGAGIESVFFGNAAGGFTPGIYTVTVNLLPDAATKAVNFNLSALQILNSSDPLALQFDITPPAQLSNSITGSPPSSFTTTLTVPQSRPADAFQ